MISVISTIYSFAYIPSLIICGMGILLLLSWVFGTDLYDEIEDVFDDSFSTFCWVHLVCSVISTIMWFFWGHVEFPRFICYAWNTWVGFCVLLIMLFLTAEVLSSLRNYCLKKRGKK